VTIEARTWLPANSFTLERVREALGDILDDWARSWMGSTTMTVARVNTAQALGRLSEDAELRSSDGTIDLVLSGHGKRNLIEAALRVELAGAPLNDADHRLLTLFAKKLVDDLAEKIRRSIGEDTGQDDARIALTLALDGKDSMSLALPRSTIAQCIKARIARSSRAIKPTRRRIALASTFVGIEAVLGRVSLSVEDLKGLAIGDVLVLDRPATAPVDLKISETGRHLRSGILQSDHGRVAVQL